APSVIMVAANPAHVSDPETSSARRLATPTVAPTPTPPTIWAPTRVRTVRRCTLVTSVTAPGYPRPVGRVSASRPDRPRRDPVELGGDRCVLLDRYRRAERARHDQVAGPQGVAAAADLGGEPADGQQRVTEHL